MSEWSTYRPLVDSFSYSPRKAALNPQTESSLCSRYAAATAWCYMNFWNARSARLDRLPVAMKAAQCLHAANAPPFLNTRSPCSLKPTRINLDSRTLVAKITLHPAGTRERTAGTDAANRSNRIQTPSLASRCRAARGARDRIKLLQ